MGITMQDGETRRGVASHNGTGGTEEALAKQTLLTKLREVFRSQEKVNLNAITSFRLTRVGVLRKQ